MSDETTIFLEDDDPPVVVLSERNRYYCKECDKSFPRALGLTMHRKWHDTKRYQCLPCNLTFSSESRLQSHIYQHKQGSLLDEDDVKKFKFDPISNRNKCDTCKIKTPTHDELIQHMTTIHLRCHLCPSFKSKFKNLEHMKTHFEDVHHYLPCRWCHLIFSKRDGLLTHFRTVHSDLSEYDPQMTSGQLIDYILRGSKKLKTTAILRQIETVFPYFYLSETSETWKKRILTELRQNSKYTSVLYNKNSSEPVFLLNQESLTKRRDEYEPEPKCQRLPDHIFQLIYEDEDDDDDNGNEGNDDESRKRKRSRKPLTVYAMCSLCGRLFGDTESLLHHVETGCKKPESLKIRENCENNGENNDDSASVSDASSSSSSVVVVVVKCPFCKTTMENFRELIHHVLVSKTCCRSPYITGSTSSSSSSPPRRLNICKYCPSFVWDLQSRDHYHQEHSDKKNRKKSAKCKLCHSEFENNETLKSHFLRHIGDVWTCRVCSFQCHRIEDFYRHSSSIHVQPTNIINNTDPSRTCSVCQLLFVTSQDRDSHVMTSTDHPGCVLCLEPFSTWTELDSHFESKTFDPSHSEFYCSSCHKIFTSVQNATLHRKLQHDKTRETRNSSKRDSETILLLLFQSDLQTIPETWQSEITTTDSRFRCEICGFLCQEIEELMIHVKRSQHKSLFCLKCSEYYLTTSLLKKHYYIEPGHVPKDVSISIVSEEDRLSGVCPSCPGKPSFESERGLRHHVKISHNLV